MCPPQRFHELQNVKVLLQFLEIRWSWHFKYWNSAVLSKPTICYIQYSLNCMLYTNYYGCCRLFQTAIKNCKVPHLNSTTLNCIQVTTLTCCNIQVKQRYWTMLATSDRCYVPHWLLVPWRCSVKVWPVWSLKLLLNQRFSNFFIPSLPKPYKANTR